MSTIGRYDEDNLRAGLAAQDMRVRELERQLIEKGDGILCHDCRDAGWLENSAEGRYVCPCIRETEPYQELEKQLAAKDALLRQSQEALMAVSPLMIPGVTWSCNVGTMIKSMVRMAVDAIDKELGK